MHRSFIAFMLVALPAVALAQDDGYGKWEVVTEMKTSGSGGSGSFSSTTTECRSAETIEDGSSQWTMNECRMESKSGSGKSRTTMRCGRAGGDYEETMTETTADAASYKTVVTVTTVSGGEKSVMTTTMTGRRIGPCDE